MIAFALHQKYLGTGGEEMCIRDRYSIGGKGNEEIQKNIWKKEIEYRIKKEGMAITCLLYTSTDTLYNQICLIPYRSGEAGRSRHTNYNEERHRTDSHL